MRFRRKWLSVSKYRHLWATAMLILLGLCMSAQPRSEWKLFKSRGGWSISYPKQWEISSCRSCKDPTAPGVFVDFFPPGMRTDEGWVMVGPLQDKPSGMTTDDDWLGKISKTNNVNKQIAEEKVRLNRIPALKVRYRTENREEMESVYLAVGSRTFVVNFTSDLSANRSGVPLESFPNYRCYLKMLDTLRVTPQ
jgi:hypothetical protein